MALLDHVSVGVANIETARAFYDPVLATIGCRCLASGGDFAAYGNDHIEFLLLLPYDGTAPTFGNGTHVAFATASEQSVHAFHAEGLAHGGSDEGAPGPRPIYPMPNVYAAFLRDPYGNKLEIVCNGFGSIVK